MHFDRLGPYRIGARIGRGGMGEVYEGVDTTSDQRVAIKVLNPALATAEGFRDRFEAEIESLRQLDHPNIVRLYGYGEQHGYLFYGMELVEGRSLESELNAGRRFSWREVTHIAIQVCRALKHAHDHGIIHRDLKPANLLLTEDDRVKLLDFGIARLFGGTHLTSAGGVLGTADYMAPEQADGRPVTDRCDQYALGGVLYALVAGRPPFQADSLAELLQLQRFATPEPVRRYARDVPEELERIILQLLAKDPEERFSSMLVLTRRLEAMEKALSRPIQPDDVLLDDDIPLADAPTDMLKATRAYGPPGDSGRSGPSGDREEQGERRVPEQPQTHWSGAGPAAAPAATAGTSDQASFTTVEQARRAQRRAEDAWGGPMLLQLAAIVAALVLLLGALWYLMKPPSPDALYAAVEVAAASGRPQDLLEVESQIGSFLERFPDDPRAAQVGAYQQELEVALLERRLRARARRSGVAGELSMAERIYVDAIRLEESDPEQAARQLEALVDLYGDEQDLSTDQQRCVDIARRQLARLRQQLDRYVPNDLKALRQRLDRAAQIRHSDPEQAERIWQAIIELGHDKPWAEEVVQEARSALAAQQARTPSDTPQPK